MVAIFRPFSRFDLRRVRNGLVIMAITITSPLRVTEFLCLWCQQTHSRFCIIFLFSL